MEKWEKDEIPKEAAKRVYCGADSHFHSQATDLRAKNFAQWAKLGVPPTEWKKLCEIAFTSEEECESALEGLENNPDLLLVTKDMLANLTKKAR